MTSPDCGNKTRGQMTKQKIAAQKTTRKYILDGLEPLFIC